MTLSRLCVERCGRPTRTPCSERCAECYRRRERAQLRASKRRFIERHGSRRAHGRRT